jgi:hypothetical protein
VAADVRYAARTFRAALGGTAGEQRSDADRGGVPAPAVPAVTSPAASSLSSCPQRYASVCQLGAIWGSFDPRGPGVASPPVNWPNSPALRESDCATCSRRHRGTTRVRIARTVDPVGTVLWHGTPPEVHSGECGPRRPPDSGITRRCERRVGSGYPGANRLSVPTAGGALLRVRRSGGVTTTAGLGVHGLGRRRTA